MRALLNPRTAARVALEVALLAKDIAGAVNDRLTCKAIGCDWKWHTTTMGPRCWCERSGCNPPLMSSEPPMEPNHFERVTWSP